MLTRTKSYRDVAEECGAEVEMTVWDLHRPASMNDFLQPGGSIVHLADLQGRGATENLSVTRDLFGACVAAGVKRIVQFSKVAVGGRTESHAVS